MGILYDAERCRAIAVEERAVADIMRDPDARGYMIRCAEVWERLAQRADERMQHKCLT